ncbi:MAG TPA: tRNA epoxyqueuosine(34) reductase QueG [Bryobacteraceae bacterium]|nr:tRNA epoxyqueuosine(34) reductase QueG [Bryobacteraceae bacterium]
MITSQRIEELARACGFEFAGVAPAAPLAEASWYHGWTAAGYGGEMRYLTDHRAAVRDDPRNLLPSARSMVCVARLYNGPEPYSTEFDEPARAWISRYAWGDDYHDVLRTGLERLAVRIREEAGCAFEHRVCVDTAPLLERAYARRAGLGWIGKNTCLIREGAGSWFFLGELLLSLELEPGLPPPDRCGSCSRCIDACPTSAIVPADSPDGPSHTVDSRLCISYFTIELRGPVPPAQHDGIGRQVFGCDICQDVCPWNRHAPVTADPAFAPRELAPPLERLAALSEEEFRAMFRASPVRRARYTGFLRNVAIAMGNAGLPAFQAPLERLAASPDASVADAARRALGRLTEEERAKHV